MSIGIIRNLGIAGGGGVALTYLYKDGLQYVALDNIGYRRSSYYTSDGGVVFNEGSMTLDMPATAHCRNVFTNNAIDLSSYSSLKIEFSYNGTKHQRTLNISSVSGSGYIIIQTLHYVDRCQFGVSVSSQKADYGTNLMADSVEDIGNYDVTISRVWLEK